MSKFIWSIVGLLLASWVVGVVFKLAEGVIHLLLVPAAFLGIFNIVKNVRGPATE